jgi:hypothetical protein
MRVQAGHRDARRRPQAPRRRLVRDAQRLQHASKRHRSIAWRSDTWMLTSTVRSSDWPASCAPALRPRVCPERRPPRPAAFPCGPESRPPSRRRRPAPPCGWAQSPARRTAMQFGGTPGRSARLSSIATGNASGDATSAAARRNVATSPTTAQPAMSAGASRKARAMISGPMPAASPMVMSKGLATRHAPLHGKEFRHHSAFSGRTDHNREKMGKPAGGKAPRQIKRRRGLVQMHSWGILAQTTMRRLASLRAQR